jgi:hypothetical protein
MTDILPEFTYFATHPVIDHEHYGADLDEYRRVDGAQMLILHLRFYTFGKEALKRLLNEWRILRQCITTPVCAFGEVDDTKWQRFVELLGFQYLTTISFGDGSPDRRLFVSYPDAQERTVDAGFEREHQPDDEPDHQSDCQPDRLDE